MLHLTKQLTLNVKLRETATFANYVGNAQVVLQQANGWVYLWGDRSSGKSHLLQACCHDYPQSIYLAGLEKLEPQVLVGLESLELICIDDIDMILGNRDWEEALFHLMNHVLDNQSKLCLAGSRPVGLLSICLADLSSRIKAATMVETDQLTDEQKLQVLTQRADQLGFRFSEEVCRFILQRTGRDIHHLMDLLHQLEIETLNQQKRITIPFVKQILNLY